MNRIHLALVIVTLAVVVGCESPPGRGGRSLTLLDPKTTPVIVLPESPSAAESFAARELQTYLGKISGRMVAITNAVRLSARPLIVLGAHPLNHDLGWQSLTPDEFIIEVSAGRVRIAGGRAEPVRDAKGNVHVQERGTLYGVYELLESLGVRWYRPDPWGEHLPRLDRIVLPRGRTTYRPGYAYRFGFNGYRWWKNETTEQRQWGRLWGTRQRQNVNMWTPPEMGGYYTINAGHAYMYLVPHQQYFASHPEYFALINGKRSANPQAQLCLSNPEVLRLVTEAVIAQAKNNPHLLAISVEPNDGSLWCECDACRAMDDPKLLNAWGGVSMANRVCAFNNQVARRLAEAVPGASVNWYAYNKHTEVPTLVKKLEPNTLVWAAAYAGAYSDWTKNLHDPTSVQNARFVRILKGYGALTRLLVYEYFTGYAWFGPMPTVGMLTDRMRHYRDHGVAGVYTQGPGHWGPQGLVHYFAAKLMWNPDLDVRKELDLYYRNYYGPAAEPMKQYHETMERAVQGGPYFGSGGSYLENFFTDDLLARLNGPMQQARQLVRGQQPYQQRLEGVWAGYEFARRLREFYKLKAAADVLAADKTLKDIETFVLSFTNGDVFDNGPDSEPLGHLRGLGKELREQAELLRQFTNPRILQDHSKQWRFQTDPKDEGVRAGWMKPELDDTTWPLLDADRWWQEQGYPNYHGTAWYRRRFQPPARQGDQRIILWFGAVDGDATVFVNGQKVGEHILLPDGTGWDKPFYFDITDFLLEGKPNVMAVRVHKEVALSGIFKGVKLLRVDRLEPSVAR